MITVSPEVTVARAGVPLSVVMPAYNEEAAIADAVREVQEHVFALIPTAELLVVNDGSRDRTGAILDELAQGEPRLRVIHQPNGGHGSALRTGMNAASGDYLFLLDSDRQIPLTAFPSLWAVASRCDGAFGVRVNRHDAPIRLALTRLVRAALRPLFGVRIHDANVPFKIVRRSAWEAARPFIPDDTLAPSLFLAVFMTRCGYEVARLQVPHQERRTGTVSIKRWKLLKFCAGAFRQLLAFRARLSRELPGRRAASAQCPADFPHPIKAPS
jgi:glycosyltransferase involved in cell wall biosynthesis